MTKQVQDAYIVAATRTPVGKAPRGMFQTRAPRRHARARAEAVLAQVPGLDPARSTT